jgi:hypothetical protein
LRGSLGIPGVVGSVKLDVMTFETYHAWLTESQCTEDGC